MGENSIKSIMDTTMEKLRAIVDADTIIGTPIVTGNVTMIPVSKVSFGMATGGSDFQSKNGNSPLFGGGGGAGVSINPIAFIVISGDNVKMLPINNESTAVDKAIALAPELIEKVKKLFSKPKGEEIEL